SNRSFFSRVRRPTRTTLFPYTTLFRSKRLGGLVEAVGYCMQSAAHPGLREAAERHIAEFGVQRYFKRRRLAALDLLPPEPEPDPAPEPSPVRGGVLRRLRRRFSS